MPQGKVGLKKVNVTLKKGQRVQDASRGTKKGLAAKNVKATSKHKQVLQAQQKIQKKYSGSMSVKYENELAAKVQNYSGKLSIIKPDEQVIAKSESRRLKKKKKALEDSRK